MLFKKKPSKTQILFSLLGITLFFSSGIYIFYERKNLFDSESIESSIQRILPPGESIKNIEKMEGGFSNDIWQIYTENKRYILREKTKKTSASSFVRDLEMAKKAFLYEIGPEVIGVNIRKQQMLLEYIENIAWPTYEENAEPYKKTMRTLRSFHEKMPSSASIERKVHYTPFDSIFQKGKLLEKNEATPSHYSLALKKTEEIFKELQPWIKKNATLCHGDFCKQNVLLDQNFKPILIDFDSASIGDPLFDVVKFSLSLPFSQRLELLNEYLERKTPSIEELRHFEMMDLTLLMLIATIRFNFVQNLDTSQEKLSKTEMETILNSEEPLPSFLDVPFEDTSPKARQLGALYALAEFLKKSAELNK